jgi:hypothetical protein
MVSRARFAAKELLGLANEIYACLKLRRQRAIEAAAAHEEIHIEDILRGHRRAPDVAARSKGRIGTRALPAPPQARPLPYLFRLA